MVCNELEAVHQFVSPAKYLATDRRMSRSVSSLVFSARRCATSARSLAASCSGVSPGSGRGALLVPCLHRNTRVFQPCGQGAVGYAEIGGNPGYGRTVGVAVELDCVAAELFGVIPFGYRVRYSRFP